MTQKGERKCHDGMWIIPGRSWRKRVADGWGIRGPCILSFVAQPTDWSPPGNEAERMSSISFTYLYQYFQVFKAHLEGLPNAGQLDECLEDGALEEFFIIDLPLKEGLSQAFALIGRQREGVVAEGRFPIDEDAVAIVEDTVLADGRHHRYGQLYAQRAHQDRSVKRRRRKKSCITQTDGQVQSSVLISYTGRGTIKIPRATSQSTTGSALLLHFSSTIVALPPFVPFHSDGHKTWLGRELSYILLLLKGMRDDDLIRVRSTRRMKASRSLKTLKVERLS